MPDYAYRCPDGHVSEQYFRIRERVAQIRCRHDGCRRMAKRSLADERPNVIPDVPEHFNLSLGCGVKSRAHLKELQKQHGVQDYEKQRNHGPSTSWK